MVKQDPHQFDGSSSSSPSTKSSKSCMIPYRFISGLILVTGAMLLKLHKFHFGETSSSDNQIMKERGIPTPQHVSQQVCLTKECIQQAGYNLSRAWPMKQYDSWCLHDEQSWFSEYFNWGPNKWDEGLLLVKNPKAASTSMAGLTLRIARQNKCEKVEYVHRIAYNYRNHNVNRSFIMAPVRDPAQHETSHISYSMSKGMWASNRTDEGIIWLLRTNVDAGDHKGKGGPQYAYVSMEDDFTLKKDMVYNHQYDIPMVHPTIIQHKLRGVMQEYDFMVLVDRWEESLVALALITGISLGDVVLTAQAKQGGQYMVHYQTHRPYRECVKLIDKKDLKTPAVQEYLDSDQFRAAYYADYLLMAAVNASLDRTIDETIGRPKFDAAMTEYKRLRALAMDQCADVSGYACDEDGNVLSPFQKKIKCYHLDFGCGYPCVNNVMEQEDHSRKLLL